MKEWSLKAHSESVPTLPEGRALLIRGARILDPASAHDGVGDVLLRDGKIAAIGQHLEAATDVTILNARGQWLLPGLVDLCARFREPGQTHKASFASETRAAQAAGVTEVVIPPDTSPAIDTPAMLIRLQRIAQQIGGLDVRVLGALTKGLGGEALAEMSALKGAGAVGFSNALAPVRDSLIARRALEYANGLDLTTHVFAQDATLAAGGCVHEGPVGTRLGLSPIPAAAEVAALRFWISLVEDTGARIHFCRLSTARGVELMESALARNLPISADVAMHQLFLTDQDVDGFNALCHVQPPLRTAADRDALRAAVREGTIAAICSDHKPHEADAKINPFPMTEPGVSSLETMVPLALALIDDGVLSPLSAVERLCLGPATIAGTDGGRLAVGGTANLCLIDPKAQYRIDPEKFLSAGRHTPFAERTVRGRVLRTFHRGIEVFHTADSSGRRSTPTRLG
ncbi:dihydroorotase [Sinimarinibacterium sp. CAU 1509]|uniref:dihydroorotase n=1 Tax=Sinimarinibacterium sp. CAU 1509 TaxID=2562283 RepID=UPI0010AB9270|nr:dihydroorotase [Sinimarinibacterium sp. CAU 1509]